MKYLLFILSIFAQGGVSAQIKKPATVTYSFIGKLDTSTKSLLSFASLDKEYNLVPHGNIKVLQAFYSSSTIWDESHIVLVDSTTFYCYSLSCLSRFYSFGYYKRTKEGIVLLPDIRVAKEMQNLAYVFKDLTYYQLPKTHFRLNNNVLSWLKEKNNN